MPDGPESDAAFAARVQRAIATALGVKALALSYTQVLEMERLPLPPSAIASGAV